MADQETETQPLRLFQCKMNDETFWIAATGPWQALDVMRQAEPDDAETDEIFVAECEEKYVEGKNFTDDDGAKRTLWEQFKLQTEPGLFAGTVF